MDESASRSATPCAPPASPLLALPSVLLPEVLSWSTDLATADALLNTCAGLHALRRDPAAEALLLLRCNCHNYAAAVSACGRTCPGGTAAVVQQVLRLLAARQLTLPNTDSCLEPHGMDKDVAPLLQGMLYAAAYSGDAAGIRALLSLPQPPNINGAECRALKLALDRDHPHLEALRALLDHGAFAATSSRGIPSWAPPMATSSPVRTAALPLLLQHIHPQMLMPTLNATVVEAICNECAEAVAILVPAIEAACVRDSASSKASASTRMLSTAVDHSPGMLQVVIDCSTSPIPWLDNALLRSALVLRVASVRVLLDAGANPNAADEQGMGPLQRVFMYVEMVVRQGQGYSQEEKAKTLALLVLLLHRGAVVTLAAIADAQHLPLCGRLLQDAVDSVRGV